MEYNIIIIGAGIVGLSTALKLKEKNPSLSILILEKENKIATHQTGNNSGVIHSGIYYKPGSQKAINCINGYKKLLDFCDTHKIDYEICGKIVVATDKSELPALDKLYKRGKENSLENIKLLTAQEIKDHEPHIKGIRGIHIPQTGIVNYTAIAEKMRELFIKTGGKIQLNAKVLKVNKLEKSISIHTSDHKYTANILVNCAGLYADKIAESNGGKKEFKIIPFRGEYYKLAKEKEYLIKNLVYPVPNPNFPFLGIHFTRSKKGGIEVGPNAVLAYSREGYKKSQINIKELIDTLSWKGFRKVAKKYWRIGLSEFYQSYSKSAFTKTLQKLLPDIKASDLVKGGAGVRAQACDREGNLIDDFIIKEDGHIINVYNAPSPAATSSLSIGSSIAGRIIKKINAEI